MYPILFSIGPIHIFSFSVFLVLSWLLFSFLFWRYLHTWGVSDESIFDLTFYQTIVALIGARGVFVLTHWNLFADAPLRIFALWIAPGLSLYGAFVGAIATVIYLGRSRGVRVGMLLDAIALLIAPVLFLGEIGSLLVGTEVVIMTDVSWAVRYAGHLGRRHPIQIYTMTLLVLLWVILLVLQKKAVQRKWPYGMVGIWFFLLFSPGMFLLELGKDGSVYWGALSVNQWILIGVFAEALGALYVRGGGREAIRPLVRRGVTGLTRSVGDMYAKISKRSTR